MKKGFIAIFLVVVSFTGTVLAGGLGLTGKISTLGLGADISAGLTEKLNVRAGFNVFSYEYEDSSDNVNGSDPEDITVGVDWQSFSGLLDYHVFGGSFRITGGVILNNNEINLSADAGDFLEIGDSWLGEIASFNGVVGFDDVAPYIGIGFGNAVDGDGRFSFAVDLGVMFQGSPDIDLTGVAASSALQFALDKALEEEEEEIEDDTSSLDIYPVISVGLSYRF